MATRGAHVRLEVDVARFTKSVRRARAWLDSLAAWLDREASREDAARSAMHAEYDRRRRARRRRRR